MPLLVGLFSSKYLTTTSYISLILAMDDPDSADFSQLLDPSQMDASVASDVALDETIPDSIK
jgi:hypothetical protein